MDLPSGEMQLRDRFILYTIIILYIIISNISRVVLCRVARLKLITKNVDFGVNSPPSCA